MNKIAIMVDSAADISNEEAIELGIHVIRMPLGVGEKTFLEFDEISDEEFFEAMNNGESVKTSQPILGDLIKKIDSLLVDYDQVLYIPISKGLSGTYSSAETLSKSYDGKLVVVESSYVAYPLQYLSKIAKEMADKGIDINTIKSTIENNMDMFAVIVPENLKHLKKGGRISPAAAALGSLLKICPLLKFEDGKIDVLDKVRTLKKAYKKAVEYCVDVENKEEYLWYVVGSNCDESVSELQEFAKNESGINFETSKLRAIITAHTGPGTVAVGRVKKIKY
ncbi:MAG: DegV family protein [Anaerorhabdus sp.]